MVNEAKLHTVQNEPNLLIFICPACKYGHPVWIGKPSDPARSNYPRWEWNGSLTSPTFSPSLLVHGGDGTPRCHSYIRDGNIQFLSDSTHALAGKTVPLRNISEEE